MDFPPIILKLANGMAPVSVTVGTEDEMAALLTDTIPCRRDAGGPAVYRPLPRERAVRPRGPWGEKDDDLCVLTREPADALDGQATIYVFRRFDEMVEFVKNARARGVPTAAVADLLATAVTLSARARTHDHHTAGTLGL